MSFRKLNSIPVLFCLLLLLFPELLCAWQNDKGLESSIMTFRKIFESGDLGQLYEKHADPVLKEELSKTVQEIKKDSKTIGLVSERLGFDTVSRFKKAGSDEIIRKMIFNMQNPPDSPGKMIRNAGYIDSYLTLSLLFAPYDKDLAIDKKKIKGKSAVISFAGSDYSISAFYVLRKNVWYMTTKKYAR